MTFCAIKTKARLIRQRIPTYIDCRRRVQSRVRLRESVAAAMQSSDKSTRTARELGSLTELNWFLDRVELGSLTELTSRRPTIRGELTAVYLVARKRH